MILELETKSHLAPALLFAGVGQGVAKAILNFLIMNFFPFLASSKRDHPFSLNQKVILSWVEIPCDSLKSRGTLSNFHFFGRENSKHLADSEFECLSQLTSSCAGTVCVIWSSLSDHENGLPPESPFTKCTSSSFMLSGKL